MSARCGKTEKEREDDMAKNQVLEGFLRDIGQKWDFKPRLPIETIEVSVEAKRNIRLDDPLDATVIRGYVSKMEREGGSQGFPAISVYRPKKPMNGAVYDVVDGLHRLEACARSGSDNIDAYVLKTQDPVTIEGLRRTINTMNGKRPSEFDAITQGKLLVDLGYTIKDAAKQANIPNHLLSTRMSAEKTQRRLDVLDVKISTPISSTSLRWFGQLTRDEDLKKVVVLAQEAGIGGEALKTVIDEVKAAPSHEAVDEIVTRWRADYADDIARGRRGQVKPPSSAVRRMIPKFKSIESIITEPKALESLTQAEIQTLVSRSRGMAAKLTAFADVLEKFNASRS